MALRTLHKVGHDVWRRTHASCIALVTDKTSVGSALVHPARMAVHTIKSAVDSPQWEATQRVSELTIFPKTLPMTLTAIRKCAIVNIIFLMAEQTLIAQATEFAPFHPMAFSTLKGVVNSVQSVIPMEVLDNSPIIFPMTTFTLLAHFTFVLIVFGMTSNALSVHGLKPHHPALLLLKSHNFFRWTMTLTTL